MEMASCAQGGEAWCHNYYALRTYVQAQIYMKGEYMSFIFELITSPLGLPVHCLIEYVILGIIGLCSFRIGWDVSNGGPFGSFIHWIVRTAAFVVMWAVAYKLCEFGQWIYHLIW